MFQMTMIVIMVIRVITNKDSNDINKSGDYDNDENYGSNHVDDDKYDNNGENYDEYIMNVQIILCIHTWRDFRSWF